MGDRGSGTVLDAVGLFEQPLCTIHETIEPFLVIDIGFRGIVP